MSLPDEKAVERYMHSLAQSDEQYAQACASLTAAREGLKVAKALGTPKSGTVQEKENEALTSPEYTLALEKLKQAEYEKMLLSLRREQWVLGIEVWRSLSANRRRS